MKTKTGIADVQTRSLLEKLERERETLRREIEEQTLEQCIALTRSARRKARERVARAVAETRAHIEARLGLIRAALQTRIRHRRHHRQLGLLETGRAALRDNLRQRWQTQPTRREWCLALLQRAAALLQQSAWQLRHADGLSPDDMEQLRSAAEELGARLEFHHAPKLEAGAQLVAGDVSIDASLAQLCRHTPELDGALLAALETTGDR